MQSHRGRIQTLCTPETPAHASLWREKFRLILFGTYPYASQWHLHAHRFIGGPCSAHWTQSDWQVDSAAARTMVVVWIIGLSLSMALMIGGWLGLDPVYRQFKWSAGLLVLSVGAIALAIPRNPSSRSHGTSLSPNNTDGAAIYIEGMRAIPMVSVLFIGIFILLYAQTSRLRSHIRSIHRANFFHAAYVAEDVRGGLISISIGQVDANPCTPDLRNSRSTALFCYLKRCKHFRTHEYSHWRLQDTSLILILSLFDLVATARMKTSSDPL